VAAEAVVEVEGVEVERQSLAHFPPLAMRWATGISVVSEAQVAAVRAVEEGGLALVQGAPASVRSCRAPSLQRSAVTRGPSFYDLVRPQQQRRRDRETERLRRLEVDDQLKPSRLLHG